MESCGLQAQKFSHKLTHMDTLSDEMMIPRSFCSKYAHDLHEDMELKLRNGYVLPVKFDHSRGVFKGLLCFFKHFKLNGGELLVFEYFGRYNINVYILGSNLSEIKYPDFKFNMPESPPRLVTLGDGGWRFVWFNSGRQTTINEIQPPEAFLDRCEFSFREPMKYVISNGKKFGCSYCPSSRKFIGLDCVCEMLKNTGTKEIHMLLFKYDVDSVITISAFDKELCEIVYPGTPLSIVEAGGDHPSIGFQFEIHVEEIHMSPECYVVYISPLFKKLCSMWDTIQSIYVYSGNGSWKLDICRRDDYYRSTIEDGWQQLRDGLALEVGDICIFECPVDSLDRFNVRVVKKQ
ncbi:uncharacterized protein LOC135148051 isoform X1 [Daucus carota subsp. sativus]|uniref:uncharacterized protein LOC108226754 isoform X1 n=1 Tax=Daucus carota subsp. sativus TaxID=79200 RepID=UPI0007F0137B|nr:PREDICTED: uncharacterized protein LOC108226754 isoform X3 [Daucus carota subsp. sativus]XP_017257240.1 PREDICTED: uncharacterized protein LOC108226754 isoform X3 [Daucus carota subsp. sativus]